MLVQVALLLTLDAMSELSIVRDEDGTRLRDTHIGCSPLDGFVAYRQRLECPSCSAEEAAVDSLDRSVSFLVKVCTSSALHSCTLSPLRNGGARIASPNLRPAHM